jgi:hypothetical protein
MPYYHLCPTTLAPGSVIEAGNYGRILGIFGFKHQLFNRETTLEDVRPQVNPEAPSRMRCVFAFPAQRDAELFRFREFQGFGTACLYEVVPLDPVTPIFFAPLAAIESWQPNNVAAAAAYWGQGHMAGNAPVIAPKNVAELAESYEVLIGGAVQVVRRLV